MFGLVEKFLDIVEELPEKVLDVTEKAIDATGPALDKTVDSLSNWKSLEQQVLEAVTEHPEWFDDKYILEKGRYFRGLMSQMLETPECLM